MKLCDLAEQLEVKKKGLVLQPEIKKYIFK